MKRIAIVNLLVCSSVFAQTGTMLTLEDAIRIGKQNNKMLQVSSTKVDAASAKASEARASLLPTLKFEAGYRRLSDVDPFQIQPPGSPVPFVISPNVPDNYNLKIGLQQPLFTGFKLRNNTRAAEYLEQASEFDYRNDSADLIVNITSAYWMFYQTQETKTFVDENVMRLQSFLDDTENLLKAGMATRNDVLKIQVQLSNAKLTQIDAANDMQIARMNLNNVIGQSLDIDIRPASHPEQKFDADSSVSEFNEASIKRLTSQALQSRSDLLAMQSRIEASKAYTTAAQGNWLPQIFLGGNFYYNRPNARYQPIRNEFKSTWDVGITLQFDIWNWGTTLYQTEQAQAGLRQNQILYEQMKSNISLEVKQYHLQVQRAREKIAVAKIAIDQAEENMRMTSDKFKNGLATSSELLDADVSLLQTKTNYTGALVEYELAHTRLNKAVGGGD